jgi:hypothetical protein
VTAGAPGLYDPAVASAGLTLDTELGPVDTVAIERALSGRPVDLTAAEVAYLFTRLAPTRTAARPVAAALDLSPETVRSRSLSAHKVA